MSLLTFHVKLVHTQWEKSSKKQSEEVRFY